MNPRHRAVPAGAISRAGSARTKPTPRRPRATHGRAARVTAQPVGAALAGHPLPSRSAHRVRPADRIGRRPSADGKPPRRLRRRPRGRSGPQEIGPAGDRALRGIGPCPTGRRRADKGRRHRLRPRRDGPPPRPGTPGADKDRDSRDLVKEPREPESTPHATPAPPTMAAHHPASASPSGRPDKKREPIEAIPGCLEPVGGRRHDRTRRPPRHPPPTPAASPDRPPPTSHIRRWSRTLAGGRQARGFAGVTCDRRTSPAAIAAWRRRTRASADGGPRRWVG